MNKNPVLLSDLSRCEPADGLSRDLEKDHERLVDYERVDGVKGVMVLADPKPGVSCFGCPTSHDRRFENEEAFGSTLDRRCALKTLMGHATRYSFNNFG